MDIFNNEKILYNNKNGIEYIQFKRLLEYGIKHAYTLKGENLNFRSSAPEMEISYKKVFTALGLDVKTLMKPIQKHTSNVKCIDQLVSKEKLENIDGLITDKPNIAITTTNADCILFMFYDPVKKVIANIHSGWRGTFQKISEKCVIKMINYYNNLNLVQVDKNEKIAENFKNEDWNNFNENQIIIEGDTIHYCKF